MQLEWAIKDEDKLVEDAKKSGYAPHPSLLPVPSC